MSEHTPAPWILGKSEGGERLILGPATGPFQAAIVAKVMTGNIADDWLIQHGPDMLAALEQIAKGEGAFSRDHLTHATNVIEEAKAIARAAITKARGHRAPASGLTEADREAVALNLIDPEGALDNALSRAERAEIALARELAPKEPPHVGAIRLCIVCAYPKPWGIFDQPTGVAVCVDCRDKARGAHATPPTLGQSGLAKALRRAHACATLRADGTCDGCFVSDALSGAPASARSAAPESAEGGGGGAPAAGEREALADIDRWATARRICGCWACAHGPMDSQCSVRARAFAALAPPSTVGRAR